MKKFSIYGIDPAYKKDTIIGVIIKDYFCPDCETSFDCHFNYYNHRKLVHVDFTNEMPISVVEL